jgi:hypothetical protein
MADEKQKIMTLDEMSRVIVQATLTVASLQRINAKLTKAGRQMLDAFGGDVPDWLEEDGAYAELEDAVTESETGI